MRSSVDLPQPEPPNRQKISPLKIFSETLLTATKSPNRLVMFSMRTYASAFGSRHGSLLLLFLSARRSAVCMAVPRCNGLENGRRSLSGGRPDHLPVRNLVQVRVSVRVNSALSGRSGTSFGIISGVGKMPGLFLTAASTIGQEAALLLAKLMKLLFFAATSARSM